jgi:uncharacterized membrane protein
MKPQRFLIGDAVSYGWQTMTANVWFFVLIFLIFFVASGIVSGPWNWAVRSNSAVLVILGVIFGLLNIVISTFINMAQIRIGLDFCDQKPADYNDLVSEYPRFWRFLGGMILYGLIVFAGLILLIIPGIYWGIRYHFVGYLILDRDMGIMDALKKSGQITRGAWWHLFVFALAMMGISIIGFILCFVGSFFALPIVIVATAYVYRSLLATEPAAQMTPPPMQQPAAPDA